MWEGWCGHDLVKQVGWRVLTHSDGPGVHAIVEFMRDANYVLAVEVDVPPGQANGGWFGEEYTGPVRVRVSNPNAAVAYIIERGEK